MTLFYMGTQLPLPKKGAELQSLAHVCCGQTAGWIKMALGTDVSLGPGHIVLDGDPAPLPKKGTEPHPNFRPIFLWPNGWMHQDATWYMDVSLSPGDFVLDGDPAPSPKGAEPTSIAAKRLHASRCHLVRDVIDGDPAPSPLKGTAPNFRPMSVVAKQLDGLRCHLVWR